MVARTIVQPLPVGVPIMHWPVSNAEELLVAIEGVAEEGLFPADYAPDKLRGAIAEGDQELLDIQASSSFTWLAEDLRDGRTPVPARVQWFAVDPDQDRMPTEKLMARALSGEGVKKVLDGLTPVHPDYEVLKAALAATYEPDREPRLEDKLDQMPESADSTPFEAAFAEETASMKPDADGGPDEMLVGSEAQAEPASEEIPEVTVSVAANVETEAEKEEKRAVIRANMDRWRWLPRDLGRAYVITNVPEFQMRLIVRNSAVRTYRTIVGKPGRTATPQLAETITGVVFNPTWTVPQSIVKGEGLGQRVLSNPAWAKSQGYVATRSANGYISVVQQPGPRNALGLMKIDLPNEHAIYFHDTPSRHLFQRKVRAFSHGCIRTERAVELGMTLAILGAGMAPEEAASISRSGEYTKVEITRTFPAYITYFTMGTDVEGKLTRFDDIYERDGPVLESFTKERQGKTLQRTSDEAIFLLDNPL